LVCDINATQNRDYRIGTFVQKRLEHFNLGLSLESVGPFKFLSNLRHLLYRGKSILQIYTVMGLTGGEEERWVFGVVKIMKVVISHFAVVLSLNLSVTLSL
jgi:hypothetical protein